MSTLEERREARRRRRQQDEESGVTETPAEEDTTSRRSRRRRGTEDEIDTGNTEVTESAPEPVSATVPEPQVDREEEERRRREEEEEAERQRQAAEAARRRAQEEEDRRRQQEEEKRRQEAEERRRREEEERKERERLEEEEREREEAARIMEEQQQKKKKGKRKGLGGLSPEKKKMLKKLIMQKAAEDLRNEAKAKAEEKERYINERVGVLSLEGKAEGDLVKLCKELHKKLSQLEEEVYDWEVKIRKQDAEIIQLTLKVNDSKGKFAKPVLKKVNKTESKLNKIAKKDKADFRDNLKSSGQSKFALDEEGEEKAE